MSPASARVVHQDRPPPEGATATALNRSRCPGMQPIEDTDAVSHIIHPGDQLTYCASAWRCERCTARIVGRDR